MVFTDPEKIEAELATKLEAELASIKIKSELASIKERLRSIQEDINDIRSRLGRSTLGRLPAARCAPLLPSSTPLPRRHDHVFGHQASLKERRHTQTLHHVENAQDGGKLFGADGAGLQTAVGVQAEGLVRGKAGGWLGESGARRGQGRVLRGHVERPGLQPRGAWQGVQHAERE